MATDGYHIFYNPEWVGKLEDREIEVCVVHVVLHVVFGHADRAGTRDPEIWNVACDHAINLFLETLGFSVPSGSALDRAYIGLTSEEIYEDLCKRGDTSSAGVGIETTGSTVGAVMGPKRSTPSLETTRRGAPGKDLLSPEDVRIRGLQDEDALDREQRRQLRMVLGAEMGECLHGTGAGLFECECRPARASVVDWKRLLRGWLCERVKTDWRTFPFSKKHLARGFYMPSMSVDIPGHIVFAIDTSGSMSMNDLALITAEIRNFRETFPSRLTVLQCDAIIQSEANYDQMDPTPMPENAVIKGRGGTDFCPVFDWIGTHSDTSCPILVYATDGYGTFPKERPKFPTIWVLTPHGVPEGRVPFGTTVRMSAAKEGRYPGASSRQSWAL